MLQIDKGRLCAVLGLMKFDLRDPIHNGAKRRLILKLGLRYDLNNGRDSVRNVEVVVHRETEKAAAERPCAYIELFRIIHPLVLPE
jgi:hypothetical protein